MMNSKTKVFQKYWAYGLFFTNKSAPAYRGAQKR
jgi:hypothetical protein